MTLVVLRSLVSRMNAYGANTGQPNVNLMTFAFPYLLDLLVRENFYDYAS